MPISAGFISNVSAVKCCFFRQSPSPAPVFNRIELRTRLAVIIDALLGPTRSHGRDVQTVFTERHGRFILGNGSEILHLKTGGMAVHEILQRRPA